MAPARPHRELVCPNDLERLLNAFLILDRTVMEISMQFYGTRSDHQLVMRRQNECLHGVLRERVTELVFGKAVVNPAKFRL
jgi:hypothetical protein